MSTSSPPTTQAEQPHPRVVDEGPVIPRIPRLRLPRQRPAVELVAAIRQLPVGPVEAIQRPAPVVAVAAQAAVLAAAPTTPVGGTRRWRTWRVIRRSTFRTDSRRTGSPRTSR